MKYNSGGILVEIERHLKLLLQLNANRLVIDLLSQLFQ